MTDVRLQSKLEDAACRAADLGPNTVLLPSKLNSFCWDVIHRNKYLVILVNTRVYSGGKINLNIVHLNPLKKHLFFFFNKRYNTFFFLKQKISVRLGTICPNLGLSFSEGHAIYPVSVSHCLL